MTVDTAIHLTHACEIWSEGNDWQFSGPTGKYAEVLAGEVRDFGGNTLFAGTADECVATKWRVSTVLTPTDWRPVAGTVAGCDHQWGWVMGEKPE